MTIRDRGFWIYLLCVLIIGVGLWLSIFLTMHHPALELRNTFIVLDTDYWSLSLQWPRGEVSIWFSAKYAEWRIWPQR
jgi:ABC-type Na+ efflux pump permease subunit